MQHNIFVTNGYRKTLRKFFAGLLMLSINLTGGVGALLLTANVAEASSTIFSDGFEATSPFIHWTSSDAKWSNSSIEHTGSKSAKVVGNTQGDQYLTKLISTVGYTDIALEFWYKADDLESADTVKLQWTTNGGVNWANGVVIDESDDDNVWHKVTTSFPFPNPDNNADFGFRFVADLSSGNDTVRIDDVVLSGTLVTYSLTATLEGAGSGSVSSDPSGISCESDCTEDYASGTEVELTAVAATGSTFSGWSGAGCSGVDTCEVTMSEIQSVTATFTLNTYELSVSTIGSGSLSSTPGSISCGMGGTACGEDFDYNTIVTLTPSANTGYSFTEWGGACSGSGSCAVTMSDEKSVSATFTADQTTEDEVCGEGYTGTYPDCVPVELSCEEDTSSLVVVSDTSNTTAVDTPAVETFEHTAWTADNNIPGATWIWDAYHVADPSVDSMVTFTKTFEVAGTPTAGTLTVGADNTYSVTLNGSPLGTSTDENNFTAGYEDSYDVSSLIVSGENTLVILVNNKAANTTNPEANPAGLIYRLVVEKNACEPAPVLICEPGVNLVENGGFEAPVLTSTWGIIAFTNPLLKWLGEFVVPDGAGRFGLELQASAAGTPHSGNQHAELDGDHPTRIYQDVETIPGNDYSLNYFFSPRPNTAASENILEVALGGGVVDTHTAAGGPGTDWASYTKSFTATDTVTRVSFADLGNDDNGSTGGVGTYLDDVSFSCIGVHVPKATVVATKVVCDSETDLPDWSGEVHAIGATTAEDYVVASNGACEIVPDWEFQWAPTSVGNPGDNTGEASGDWTTFTSSALITLGDMTQVWVREVWNDAYVAFAGITNENPEVSAELYCNGDVLHYDNLDYAGTLTDGGTIYCVAFNALQNDEEGGGGSNECEQGQHVEDDICVNDEDETPTDVCSNVEGIQESVPEGMTESEGICTEIPPPSSGGGGSSTFDYWGCTNPSALNFNALANRDDNSCDIGGGNEDNNGNGGGGGEEPQGEVLGAAIEEPEETPLPEGCSEYITTFQKIGLNNDVDDVARLQAFLNENMSANLPVTGFFGSLTKRWVKKFQVAHFAGVIQPWIDAGHDMSAYLGGSGVVYKTTRREINLIKCSSLDLPDPVLIGDGGL